MMNVLVIGGTGFIGNNIFSSLVGKHKVTIASRTPIASYPNWVKIDFAGKNDWPIILQGIDLVINAVGIIEGDFKRIQTEAPLELYETCVKRNIKVIHISAIGAEKQPPPTEFLQSKKVTDDVLLQYEHAKVVYPGVVIGKTGKTSQFFAEMAQLPMIPMFSNKPLPMVHIRQLTKLVGDIIDKFEEYPQQTFAVAEPEPLKNVLLKMKGSSAIFIVLPEFLFSLFFMLFPNAKIGIFNQYTFKLFQTISASDYEPMFPIASEEIESNNLIKSDALPELFALLSISFIWIFSGVVSLISWDTSYALMQEIGANHNLAVLFIWVGSIADIVLGITIFSKQYRKSVIILQLLVVLAYMAILSVLAPHYWLHPFGILAKNVPLIALSFYLYQKQQ
jgi:uncharacterized protein YbjT (DUF2867 family)